MTLERKEEILKHAIQMFPLESKPEDAPVLIRLLMEYDEVRSLVSCTLDNYSYHRDSAEAYLLTGQLKTALRHAKLCNKYRDEKIIERNDIIAKIKFMSGDIKGGLEAINKYNALGKKRTLDIVKFILEAYGERIDLEYLRSKYGIIFKYIEQHFGNWDSAVYKAEKHTITTFPLNPIQFRDSKYYDESFLKCLKDAETSLGGLSQQNKLLRSIYDFIQNKDYLKAINEIDNHQECNDTFYQGLKCKILFLIGDLNSIIINDSYSRTFWGMEYFIRAKLLSSVPITATDLFNISSFNSGLDYRFLQNYETFIIKVLESKILGFQNLIGTSINEYFIGKIDSNNFQEILEELARVIFEDIEKKVIELVGPNTRWISEYTLYTIIKDTFSDIEVKRYYSPQWLKPQNFDIYIPEFALAIEYNGQQHYEPIEYFGGMEAFVKTVERDARKKALSEINNIKLVLVKYDEDFEDVIKELKSIILRKQD